MSHSNSNSGVPRVDGSTASEWRFLGCLPCSPLALTWGATFPRLSLLQVQKYERLTPISVLDHALESLDNLQPGDCIVCFSKNDIYSVSRQIEIRGLESAVIYGSLPPGNHWLTSHLCHLGWDIERAQKKWNWCELFLPGTKLAQARKFNDPNDPCKILVATDAIGMGLNL
jgi:ATP-dependent RNA helicase SUPV3L1/SUV3